MNRKGKLSRMEKDILKITIDGKFERLITAYRNNGNGLVIKVRKNGFINYEPVQKVKFIYQRRYPGREIKIESLSNNSQSLKTFNKILY